MGDILFWSTVHAERLRFSREPQAAVRFPGSGKRESASCSDRIRLPDKVIAGQEYQDATVSYHFATGLIRESEAGRSKADGDRPV